MPDKKEGKFRIEFLSAWKGKIDSKSDEEKIQYLKGQKVNVDMGTFRALCFTHNIAKPLSVEEVIAEVTATKKKKPSGTRASRTKAQQEPEVDKMVKTSSTKGE